MNPFKKIKWRSVWWLAASIIIGLVASACTGIVLWAMLSYGDAREEITQAQAGADQIVGRLSEGSIAWGEIDNLGRNLLHSNQQKVQLRVLARLAIPPTDYYPLSQIWQNRYSINEREWEMSDPNALTKSIVFGTGSILLWIPATWVILLAGAAVGLILISFISALWYFILDRIKELSNAIAGRPIRNGHRD